MADEPRTLNELFNSSAEARRDSRLLRFKKDGEWRSLSYRELSARVRDLALGLYDLGIRSGDKLAIWSENRPEWNIADLAALAIGAVDVPVYTTQARSQIEYILDDSSARALFVSSAFLEQAFALKERLPALEFVIAFDGARVDEGNATSFNLEDLAEKGRLLDGREPGLYESLWQAAAPDDLATLLYTSGTTGDPKGVMLTHRNLTSSVLNTYRWLSLEGRRNDVALSYLPFTHIFERAVWYLYAYAGILVAYAESIDAVAKNLAEVRPTVMTSVPRMFEKIYSRIVERGSAAAFPRKQIFLWSLGVGRRWAEGKNSGARVGLWLGLEHKIADILVFKKWRQAVGGNIRWFISGGAPLAPEIAYLFDAAGLTILQGYGLTETSPSISCNTERRNRIGTVGPIIDNVFVKFGEDDEILVKGDTVMKGYYNRPTANEEAFTADGWFRTGDIGNLDADGFLVITDRKKEMIKTSGGKYIAPQHVESLIKASRFVSQVVVVGNARKFASALIVPNMELLRSYAQLKGIDYTNETDLLENPRILDLFYRQLDKSTPELARYEKIKKVALIERELTAESGELTPTLKPRRKIIEEKYAKTIERLYAEEAAPAVVAS